MNNFNKNHFIKDLGNIIGEKNIITTEWGKLPFSKGWRYGEGEALAVAKPGTLFEMWQIIEICVDMDIIIIMQAANTGLTGGSTPFGDDYDRPILIINTRRISNIHVLNEGKQIILLNPKLDKCDLNCAGTDTLPFLSILFSYVDKNIIHN